MGMCRSFVHLRAHRLRATSESGPFASRHSVSHSSPALRCSCSDLRSHPRQRNRRTARLCSPGDDTRTSHPHRPSPFVPLPALVPRCRSCRRTRRRRTPGRSRRRPSRDTCRRRSHTETPGARTRQTASDHRTRGCVLTDIVLLLSPFPCSAQSPRGFLGKHMWQRRWFVIEGGNLSYYKEKKEWAKGQTETHTHTAMHEGERGGRIRSARAHDWFRSDGFLFFFLSFSFAVRACVQVTSRSVWFVST